MQGQAQGHDVGVKLVEFHGGCIFRKGVRIHAEEIHQEFPVDIVEFIFIFAMLHSKVLFIHLLKVMEVIGALGVGAFVDDKVFPVFLMDKGMPAVRAAQAEGREAAAFFGRETGITDLTEELSFGTVVFIQESGRRLASGTGTFFRDGGIRASGNGFHGFSVAFLPVRDQLFVRPVLIKRLDFGKFINLELLVLWGMGILEGPLFKRDVSADKVD